MCGRSRKAWGRGGVSDGGERTGRGVGLRGASGARWQGKGWRMFSDGSRRKAGKRLYWIGVGRRDRKTREEYEL